MGRLPRVVRPRGRSATDDESVGESSSARTPILITSVIDNLAHEVTEEQFASPQAVRTGRFEAVCGHLIAPVSMCSPDGSRCAACRELSP